MSNLIAVSVTSLADMISRLNTFCSDNGWTTHHVPASGEFAARKTATGIDVACAMQWDTSTPSNLGLYHWVGAAYDSGQSPWAQPASGAVKDSGNGAASTSNGTLGTSRHAVIGNTPTTMWVFSDTYYVHVVVETEADIYTHFGFGHLDKMGTWTGGSYVYGMRHDTAVTTPISRRNHSYFLDGFADNTGTTYCATLHCESFDNQPAGGLFGLCSDRNSAPGNDRQTSAKARVEILGGFRGQPGGNDAFGFLASTTTRAPFFGVPIYCIHRDDNTDPPVHYRPIGSMPDVRQIIIRNWTPEQQVKDGDTWIVFPVRKIADNDSDTGGSKSGWAGVAYKVV